MKLQYIFLALFLITSIKVVILFFNKENLLLMRKFLKTGDPKNGWIVRIFVLTLFGCWLRQCFACYSFGFI